MGKSTAQLRHINDAKNLAYNRACSQSAGSTRTVIGRRSNKLRQSLAASHWHADQSTTDGASSASAHSSVCRHRTDRCRVRTGSDGPGWSPFRGRLGFPAHSASCRSPVTYLSGRVQDQIASYKARAGEHTKQIQVTISDSLIRNASFALANSSDTSALTCRSLRLQRHSYRSSTTPMRLRCRLCRCA